VPARHNRLRAGAREMGKAIAQENER